MSGSIPGVLFATTLRSVADEEASINTRGGEDKNEKDDTLLNDREHICPQAIELCGRRDGSRSEHRELRPLVLGQRLGERAKLPTVNQRPL
jgi:hypothetical protein